MSFDRDTALHAAVELFWRRGYAAASLEDLLVATGLARSSFYATFGSKHALMLEALSSYTQTLLARMQTAAQLSINARDALRKVVDIMACSDQPDAGCLFISMCTELLPHDPLVSKLAYVYLGKVDMLLKQILSNIGSKASNLQSRSGTIMAITTGAVTLRKAGESSERIREMLDGVGLLVA